MFLLQYTYFPLFLIVFFLFSQIELTKNDRCFFFKFFFNLLTTKGICLIFNRKNVLITACNLGLLTSNHSLEFTRTMYCIRCYFKVITSLVYYFVHFLAAICSHHLQWATLVVAFAEFCVALERNPLTPFLSISHFVFRS